MHELLIGLLTKLLPKARICPARHNILLAAICGAYSAACYTAAGNITRTPAVSQPPHPHLLFVLLQARVGKHFTYAYNGLDWVNDFETCRGSRQSPLLLPSMGAAGGCECCSAAVLVQDLHSANAIVLTTVISTITGLSGCRLIGWLGIVDSLLHLLCSVSACSLCCDQDSQGYTA